MKRIAVLCVGAVLSGACAHRDPASTATPLGIGDHTLELRHGGRLRSSIVHVPPIATRGEPLPVMLAFHGGGGNARGFKAYAGLDAVADREGFVVVYPDGTGPLRDRLLTWNGGGCCGFAADRNVDDVGFTIALLDELARRTPVDTRRIYATGHSNGAMMAYRLAAERSDRVAAIAPVAGAMTLPSFSPSTPVAVLHIHSTDDPRALYDGGLGPPFPLTDNRVFHRPVREALDRWIEADGCPTEPVITDERRSDARPGETAHTATRLVWAPCRDGVAVEHWRLTGAGHGWPGGPGSGLPERLIGPETTVIDAAGEVWVFVSRYVRQ